jgi:hypothetical protein
MAPPENVVLYSCYKNLYKRGILRKEGKVQSRSVGGAGSGQTLRNFVLRKNNRIFCIITI